MSKPLLPLDEPPAVLVIHVDKPPPLPRAHAISIDASTPGPPLALPVAAPPDSEYAEALADEAAGRGRLGQLPSWLTSMVVHLVIVLCLAMYTYADRAKQGLQLLIASMDEQGDSLNPNDVSDGIIDTGSPQSDVNELPATTPIDDLAAATSIPQLIGDPALPQLNLPPQLNGDLAVAGDLAAGIGEAVHAQFAGRLSAARRADAVRKGGGTPGSERAVGYALEWLANHQLADGGWSFDHRRCRKCRGRCGQHGTLGDARNAATAMALMPFLGAGQTHLNGQYKTQIDKGIKYLLRSMKVEKETGSLWEMSGTMYSHGLASIVLCEAYGMTHDPDLKVPAQHALNFIVAAQNSEGGWRYHPGQPGDTSVVGWQLMALTSGRLAYLEVPPDTFRKAGYFLDFVQSNDGAQYGYTSSGTGAATSAIGLLCRMYLGWTQDHPALLDGVRTLNGWGPGTDRRGPQYNINNMYYNYYATQVMHHHGGDAWKKWNEVMRDYLVRTQSQRGHELGSWYLPGSDLGAGDGGRVYCTAMAAMILEVYYRHMPIYGQHSTQQALGN